jgi:hypothetical protein
MRKLLFALLLCAAPAFAATRYVGEVNIISPDTATGFKIYWNFQYTAEGEIVVCPLPDSRVGDACVDPQRMNRWQLLRDAIPKGRVYAGFGIDPSSSNKIYVFWK